MRKNNPILFLILILFLNSLSMIAHADPNSQYTTIYPHINKFVKSRDFNKYHNIVVLPFSDAPSAQNSGQIAQGLASMIFGQAGFKVVERSRLNNVIEEQKLSSSGLINENQSIHIGKLLGVKGVVVGEVSQYQSVVRTHRSVCEGLDFRAAFGGHIDCSQEVAIPQDQQITSYVSSTMRIIDVESGEIIYSASGHFSEGLRDPPQVILESLLTYMILNWSDKFK